MKQKKSEQHSRKDKTHRIETGVCPDEKKRNPAQIKSESHFTRQKFIGVFGRETKSDQVETSESGPDQHSGGFAGSGAVDCDEIKSDNDQEQNSNHPSSLFGSIS